MQLLRAVRRQTFRSVNALVEPLVRRGVGSPLVVGAGLVLVQTEGRRSRRERTRPLVSLRVGDQLVVGTVRSSSDWVANLAAADDASVWVGGARRSASASVRRLGTGSVARLSLGPGSDPGQ